uniref:uncharacterized protein LOC122588243 n=1 Tax=Erigeron canadensis TaxID=72917 RepID=UPI001CB97FCF|nr:uncharacterized protein LOC122588243 [Erigeron canadensis]
MNLFPRLVALDMDKQCLVSERRDGSGWLWKWRRPLKYSRECDQVNQLISRLPSGIVSEERDKWLWNSHGKNKFFVAQVRKSIDHHCLPIDVNMKTNWNSLVPKKVNIFIWRMRRNCIPTNVNLFARGVDVNTLDANTTLW